MAPLFLVLIIRKFEYEALDFEKCIPKSSTNKGKRVGNSSPSTSHLIIAITSKSVGLIKVKRNTKPFMDVAQKPRKLNIKIVFTGISCQESMIIS